MKTVNIYERVIAVAYVFSHVLQKMTFYLTLVQVTSVITRLFFVESSIERTLNYRSNYRSNQ